MTLYEAIKFIISFEPDQDSKLNLLTEISIGCKNDEIFKASEMVRNDFGCETMEKVGEIILPCADPKGIFERNSRNETVGLLHEGK